MPSGARTGTGPTMRDIAREAGVSKALVSIVFRGAPGASDQTRERVLATAERLGYHRNRTASLLARSRTRQLGVVLDLHNGFQAALADAALAAADRAAYQVVLAPVTGTHPEGRAITTALESRCEALLLFGSQLDVRELSGLVGQVPVVLVGRGLGADDPQVPSLDVARTGDDDGMEQVVAHLVAAGHRRIAHVDGGAGPISATRRAGFEAAIERRTGRPPGLGLDARAVRGGMTEAAGRRAGRALVRAGPPPTAIAAFNDHCAVGVIDALTAAGLRVPDDVAVTGYDDSPLARVRAIDLTSVRQDAAALADWAVAAAAERLDAGRTQSREFVASPRLIVRGSSRVTSR